MSAPERNLELRDNPARSRFELWSGDELVGLADYHSRDDVVAIPHTEIDPKHGGLGYGSTMVRAVLDELRAKHQRVIPQCSFVAAFIERNPEYRDLVA